MGKEALVVCSDRSLGVGITIWDIESGDQLLHIPTCASPVHGLLCLRNQFLVASQVNKHGSLGGGAIFMWPLNKPQRPLQSYPIEAIGPVCCTKDGLYLAGGAPSGNAYLWEVANGRLLKSWHAHHKSLNCVVFSFDDSLLISGSDDGMIHVWSIISLLDVADCGHLPSLYYSTSEHKSSITGLLSTFGSSSSVFISSSLDGTCKVWDLVAERLLQTHVFPISITSIALDPGEQLLLSGSDDGKIFVNTINIGLIDNPFLVLDDQSVVLNGHNNSVTAMAFCRLGMVSTSVDCTACLWDVVNWVIIRRFNHKKGAITNLLVIPQSSLFPTLNHHKTSSQSHHIPLLDKFPQPVNSSEGMTFLLNPSCSINGHQATIESQRRDSLKQQIVDLERGWTPAAVQMKVETSVENRIWATGMTKHITDINKHLQSRLLDLMQCRLQCRRDIDSPTTKKKKKLKIDSPLQGEVQPHFPD